MKLFISYALAFLCSALGTNAVAPPFEIAVANSTIYLAAAVLCDKETFPTRKYLGASAGFEYKATIYDSKSDTNGFIGILHDKIFVVYRGTSSKLDWMDDGEVWQDNANYSDCPDCKVHHGFNKCLDNTIKFVLDTVHKLRQEHPSYQILVGGHSLGGALANLAAIEIVQSGLTNVQHYSFGSPRVGNPTWAKYSNNLLTQAQRITHYKDPVPHTPPTYIPLIGDYEHILTEVYENEAHELHSCSGVDDQTCSMQWSDFQTKPDDHSLYLDVITSCPDDK